MSVLLLPPIFQFFDNNGDALANGFVDVFAAGTTTRQATYTSAAGTTQAPNPIQLNAAGRPTSGGGAIWGEGSYKFIVRDANGVQVGDVLDNVTSFSGLVTATNACRPRRSRPTYRPVLPSCRLVAYKNSTCICP